MLCALRQRGFDGLHTTRSTANHDDALPFQRRVVELRRMKDLALKDLLPSFVLSVSFGCVVVMLRQTREIDAHGYATCTDCHDHGVELAIFTAINGPFGLRMRWIVFDVFCCPGHTFD